MSNELMRLRQEELVNNPSNRVPVALCLDCSGSMTGEPMAELNEGIRLFIDAVKADPVAAASVELAIVAFSDGAQIIQDFQSIASLIDSQLTSTGGSTNLGAGVNMSLDILDARKGDYKRTGIDYFQPWLVLMTDGQPTTDEHIAASKRVLTLESSGKLVVFPIAIGAAADANTLRMFSGKREPLRLKGLNFKLFFQWLSKSVARVSQSRPGDKVQLDVDGIKGWAEI